MHGHGFGEALGRLKEHRAARPMDMRAEFAKDPQRFGALSARFDDMLFDFSKCAVTGETKAGLEALVGCYDDEMENTSVRAISVNPGAMRTKMRAGAYPGEDPMTLPEPREIVPLIVELARPDREPPRREVISFRDWKAAARP